jgi:hypothetical protein
MKRLTSYIIRWHDNETLEKRADLRQKAEKRYGWNDADHRNSRTNKRTVEDFEPLAYELDAYHEICDDCFSRGTERDARGCLAGLRQPLPNTLRDSTTLKK